MGERAVFTFTSPADWAEVNVVVASTHVRLSVEQEKAVDSYNETFECYARLTHDEARQLAEAILAAIPKPPTA